jgi:CheY-like chemotaxis protein
VAHILVVEDHKDSADVLITALRKAGHTFEHVLDGRAALDAMSAHTPDLVVLDLRLPTFDGIAFLQVMRSYLRWREIPVIVVSAGTEMELDRVTQLGARRIFRKARFDLKDFMAAVEELLEAGGTASRPMGDDDWGRTSIFK